MLNERSDFKKIYIACGYTDLRYGVDGLALEIQQVYHLDPFDEGTLFIFCGRKSDRIKALYWDGDGFLLLYKRLSKGKYQWPRSKEEIRQLTPRQYKLLVTGFSPFSTIEKVRPKYAG